MAFDLDTSFAFLIAEVSRLKRREFDAEIGKLGIQVTSTEAAALVYLGRVDDMRQSDLAHRLGVEPMIMSLLMKRLEELQFITRRKDPADKRGKRLSLTASGRDMFERITGVMAIIEERTAAMASREDWGSMLRFLADLRVHLIAEEELRTPG